MLGSQPERSAGKLPSSRDRKIGRLTSTGVTSKILRRAMADRTAADAWPKRLFFKSPRVTSALRLTSALLRHLTRPVHEPDFYCLQTLPEFNGLALDIGANSGQSAVTILKMKPGFSVVSIEPNPACLRALMLHQRLFGDRMRVIQAGASDQSGTLTFHVPVRNGRQLLEEGTFDRSTLAISHHRIGREGVDFTVESVECKVIAVDSLNLRPSFVKIDVQGYELQVVRGMVETLRASKPLLLIEAGAHTDVVSEFLQPLGYRKLYWNGDDFTDTRPDGCFNCVMVATPRVSSVTS